MKNVIVICLVLITGALSAQDNPKKATQKPQQTEKKQASTSVKNDLSAPEASPAPGAQPAAEPQNRSIDEKGLSTKTETGKKQQVIQPDPKAVKTQQKKANIKPE